MLTTEEKALCRTDREKVEQLCREERWEEAYDAFCASPWASDRHKGSFDAFVSSQKARIQREDGGLSYSIKSTASLFLMLVLFLVSVGFLMRGALLPYDAPEKLSHLVITLVCLGCAGTVFLYRSKVLKA